MDKTKENYGVILLRTDQSHIVIKAVGFEEAYKKWAEYRDLWMTCLHEKKPLQVVEFDQQLVAAFDPALVYEITLRKKDAVVNENNPYYKEMVEKGFSNTLKTNSGVTRDLLDQGYRV